MKTAIYPVRIEDEKKTARKWFVGSADYQAARRECRADETVYEVEVVTYGLQSVKNEYGWACGKEEGEQRHYQRTRNRRINILLRSLQTMPGGINPRREQIIESTINAMDDPMDMTSARIEQCADERTGRRYGERKCRRGRCVKLGSGGRNRGQVGYQLWLVWGR